MNTVTKRELKNGAQGLVVLGVLGTVLVLASTGCAASVHASHDHHGSVAGKSPAKVWKPGRRCRTVGLESTVNVTVIVQRDCVNAGVTSVGVLVRNNARKGTVAAADAAVMVKRILGFTPVLFALLVGKDKGQVFMLHVVGDVTAATASKR